MVPRGIWATGVQKPKGRTNIPWWMATVLGDFFRQSGYSFPLFIGDPKEGPVGAYYGDPASMGGGPGMMPNELQWADILKQLRGMEIERPDALIDMLSAGMASGRMSRRRRRRMQQERLPTRLDEVLG